MSGALAGCFLSLCCPHGVHPEISIKNEAEFRFATALSARSASVVGHGDRKGRELCHGAVRTECILRGFRSRPRISTLPRRCPHGVHQENIVHLRISSTLPRRCPHGVHHFEITDRLTMSELCHGAVRTECIRQKLIKNSGQRALPRRCPHGVHLRQLLNKRQILDFATALSARSASDVLASWKNSIGLCHGAVRTECICKSRQTLFVSCAVSW